jgi:hypothetical protein
MMKMLLTLALALAPQDTPGDRVEITFHSGATLSGTIVPPPPKADPGSLTLDVSWEYPGLNGTMTVAKKEIKSVRTLRSLDPETKRKLEEIKKRMAEENARPPAPEPKPPVVAPEPPKPKPEPAPDPLVEELKKAREFYAKFPAPVWSEERRNAIRLKKLRGQVPTPTEREFEANFELWEKGRKATPQ